MFKQIKKLLIALVLVFALFLVACDDECPSTEGLIKPEDCPAGDDCTGLIKPEDCPACPEAPKLDEACPEAGWIKPGDCPTLEEGIKVPEEVTFYTEDIPVKESIKFEVEITPADAFAGLIWSSSNPAVATVDAEGNITGVRPGKVTITATSAVDGDVFYEEEVEVVEKGTLDFEIAEREKNAIVAALSEGYVSADFDLPTTWNQNATVTYMDPNGAEIEKFVMPDLGEATSQNYAISGKVAYGEAVSEFNVTLKLVKAEAGKNDYEKVNFAVEVAEAFLYEYMNGAKVTEDIYLPASVYGVALGWSTNKAYVLTSEGELTRPNNDTSVTYTITPKCGAASKSHTISVVAAGYTTEEKIEYVVKNGELKNIAGAKLYADVALPEEDSQFGIKLTYKSSDEAVISSNGVVATGLMEDTKATLTVTAVYNDLNAADKAFVEVFDIEVTVAKSDADSVKVQEFAAAHPLMNHVPYGAGTEKTIVLTKSELDRYEAEGLEFVLDENFAKTADGIELVTQYFRYHEATITVKKGDAKYLWTMNVGIGAEHDIVYLGGRSQSNQASKNPAERGDMLQGFSKWDKYVGVVSSNSERTSQQYWSEFSGYTMYVDAPTGSKKTTMTKDAEGNVTVVASTEDDYIRYQMFQMQFATIEITSAVELFNADKESVGYLPRTEVDHLRTTYGGNFGTFYVNLTDKKFDLPVSALSMGGTFADGTALKTYTKSSISLALKNDGKVSEIKDDYGNALKVTREQNWSLDGYRPAFAIAPVTSALLQEGQTNVEYKFTFGVEDVNKNPNNNSTVYVQYGITSDLSPLWGTPYINLAAYGMAFGFHSQTLYSLSNIGGYALAGEDKSLPMYVSRYFRHAENEEISDYIVAQVKSYFGTLVTDGTELAKAEAKNVTFADISIDDLEKIDELKAEYDSLYASWKLKDDVKEAGRRINVMIAAAKAELEKQAAYATLTEKSFVELRTAIEALQTKSTAEAAGAIASAEIQALIAAANRNYGALTEGQKGLYDEGYESTTADLCFEAKTTEGILEAVELIVKINSLVEVVTNSNSQSVKDAAATLEDLSEVYLYSTFATITPAAETTPSTTPSQPEQPEPEVVETKVYASDLIPAAAKLKVEALLVTIKLLEVKIEDAKIAEAKAAYDTAAANAAKKAIIDKTFANVTSGEGNNTITGVAAYIANKYAEVDAAEEATKKANEAKTVTLAAEIKALLATLPTAAQFEKGEFTTEQYNNMVTLTKKDGKVDTLVSLYKTLGVAGAAAATTVELKIELIVKGKYSLGDNPATEAVETDFVIQDTKIGYLAGEKDNLTKAYACPAAYDKYQANLVIEKVEALPGAKVLTAEDEAQVNAAKAAYDAAIKVPGQKAAIEAYTSANYIATKLNAAVEGIKQVKLENASMPVEVAINAIPAVAVLTLADKATVVAARNAYNALSAEAAAKVTSLDKLERAEAKIAELEEDAILESETYKAAKKAFEEDKAFTTGVVLTAETKAAAEALIAAYEAMSNSEKAYFASKNASAQEKYEMLTSALAVYNQYA